MQGTKATVAEEHAIFTRALRPGKVGERWPWPLCIHASLQYSRIMSEQLISVGIKCVDINEQFTLDTAHGKTV